MKIYFVRHAAVEAPEGVCYGASDLPLAGDPDQLGAALRRLLPVSDRVISSPLQRCRHLAERLVSDSSDVALDARWQELDFGSWEGRRYDDMPRSALQAWANAPWSYRMPDGESGDDLRRRVQTALEGLLQQDWPSCIVVAHAGPLRVAIGTLLQLPQLDWLSLTVPLASVNPLEWRQGRVRAGETQCYDTLPPDGNAARGKQRVH